MKLFIEQQELASENETLNELERSLAQTQARIDKMKYEAMLQGNIIHFNSRYYMNEAQIHFQAKEFPKKENLPVIKRGQLKPLKLLEKQVSETTKR